MQHRQRSPSQHQHQQHLDHICSVQLFNVQKDAPPPTPPHHATARRRCTAAKGMVYHLKKREMKNGMQKIPASKITRCTDAGRLDKNNSKNSHAIDTIVRSEIHEHSTHRRSTMYVTMYDASRPLYRQRAGMAPSFRTGLAPNAHYISLYLHLPTN